MAGTAGKRPLSPAKRGLGIDVLTAARQRISRVYDDFPVVYISFSGGKDSTLCYELAAQEARARGRRLGVLIVDLEGQYEHTVAHLHTMLDRHADVSDVYWACLPIALRNAVSQFQPKWQCWDPDQREAWIRPLPEHPGVISDPGFFPWFRRDMEFETFVPLFGHWLSEQNNGRMTACIVGIRSDESLNRYRTIASRYKRKHEGLQWTTFIDGGQGSLYNAYPIYDWRTEDIWRFHGRYKDAPYNRIYDLMHQAGLSVHQARLCQPYGDDQRKGLWLFQVLEPKTWPKVVARVQGANFGARYARETGNILGRITITKPGSITWYQYAMALLESMPPETAEHFRDKISVFIRWYEDNRGYAGGVIDDDGPTSKGSANWKRICKVLLQYDYYCKGFSMAPPAHEEALKKYRQRMQRKRLEWSYAGLEPRGLR